MATNRSFRDALRFLQGNNLIFAVTDLLGNFARGMVLPYVSLYILALGGDAAQIGLVNSVGPLAGLIMFPIGGYITDHASRVRLVALGSTFSAAIVLINILAPSWEVLAVAALLQGFAVFPFPARSALIADSLPPGDRGRGIAAQNAVSWGLAIFAPYIGGVVVDAYGPNTGLRALFGVMMLFYILSAVIQIRFLKETTVHPRNEKRLTVSDLREVLRDAYEIKEIEGNSVITNSFSLLPHQPERSEVRDESSANRLKVASRMIKDISNISALKAVLRSHVPERGELSICCHWQDGGGTESSHIVQIQGGYIGWSSLIGHPCENDYRTVQLFQK